MKDMICASVHVTLSGHGYLRLPYRELTGGGGYLEFVWDSFCMGKLFKPAWNPSRCWLYSLNCLVSRGLEKSECVYRPWRRTKKKKNSTEKWTNLSNWEKNGDIDFVSDVYVYLDCESLCWLVGVVFSRGFAA